MTFLQPFILWALPLILLPVIIHLLNRIRHRPQPWAAMQFLLAANRNSVSQAKLRQFLILLFRVLAVLMLVLFLSRPLAGGWLGWALSPAPDAILILLDRSASMETTIPGAAATRREQALKLIQQAARPFEASSHLILIENAVRAPQQLANAAALEQISLTKPTDTAADIPAMLQTAVTWLIENRAGTAEIWIASDLQKSNWRAGEERWDDVIGKLAALPQRVRVRLLSFPADASAPNASIHARETLRRASGEKSEVLLTLDIQQSASPSAAEQTPMTLNLDGIPTQVDLTLESQSMVWRHKAEISQTGNGWGSVTLPADGNNRDNTSYFVYSAEMPLRARVISDNPGTARFFQLAASHGDAQGRHPAELSSPLEAAGAPWKDETLLVWHGGLPEGAAAERVRQFVEEGGAVIFFPPGSPDTRQFEGVGWGEVIDAAQDQPMRVAQWEQNEGPLARTEEGMQLPVQQLAAQRCQEIVGRFHGLASFDDGKAFLARQTLGRGEFYFCASLPSPDWSNLGSGSVLVPMLQRLLLTGSRRAQQVASVACGELSPAEAAKAWTPVEAGRKDADVRAHAGVYQLAGRYLAVNRPVSEDEPEILESEAARALFGPLPVQMFEERGQGRSQAQGEIWRALLTVMLIFLLVEGLLILPKPAPKSPSKLASAKPAAGAPAPQSA